jgi:CDGSH-type Zn-finger protein
VVTITVRENGPYRIEGDDVKLVDWNGNEYLVTRRPLALCRCGASGNRPHCDGTHARIGFHASEGTPEKQEK